MTPTDRDIALAAFWMGMHGAPASKEPGALMDVAECAAYIGRSVRAVYNLVHKGHIPTVKVGRRVQFERGRIDRWLERHARRGMLVS